MLLITQPRVGTSHNEILALRYAAESLGIEVYPAETSWRLPEDLIKSGKRGVPYGSQTFCEVIAQQMDWSLKQNSFDWLAKLPEFFLKRKVEFMTLEEAKKINETKFIKPADDKVFEAKVYAPGQLILPDSVPLDTPTLVSDVVEFDLEYRCFVTKYGVRAWSNYVFYEHIADPKFWNVVPIDSLNNVRLPTDLVGDVLHYLKYHTSDEIVPSVIDVGRIVGKGWAIIETNPCWASGLYGCDPVEALKTIIKAVEKN